MIDRVHITLSFFGGFQKAIGFGGESVWINNGNCPFDSSFVSWFDGGDGDKGTEEKKENDDDGKYKGVDGGFSSFFWFFGKFNHDPKVGEGKN